MLDAQGMRAARLVTDTGIHALGWTRERAIDTMEAIGTPHVDAVIEVDRYIAMPGQALAYMIGMIEIERAREAATARDGAASRSPTSTTGCSRSASCRSRRCDESSADRSTVPAAEPKPRLDLTRRPLTGGSACSTSISGSVRRSPWPTSSSIKVAGCRPKPARWPG